MITLTVIVLKYLYSPYSVGIVYEVNDKKMRYHVF